MSESTHRSGPAPVPGERGAQEHELDRLDAVASYGSFSPGSDPALDALTALAARFCGTPVASLTLLGADVSWFASTHGFAETWTPREVAFTSDVVAAASTLVIVDARSHPRYRSNPMVAMEPGVHAYAGVPVVGREGLPLGALAVLDARPRDFTPVQLSALEHLAAQAAVVFEQRRQDRLDGLVDVALVDDARHPARLRQAHDRGELIPYFQAVVDLHTGQPLALEALLRWQHPTLGLLRPAQFLRAIEASALIVPVGLALVDAALAQLAALRRQDVRLPSGVAVHLSSGQLARPGLADAVLALVAAHGLHPADLSLELTEVTDLPDRQLAQRELGALAAAGAGVVVDNYGVGWSNLTRVLDLPVTGLKLHPGLGAAALDDPRAALMIASTVQLAADLGLQLTATGVATEAVRRALQAAGCSRAQGWLFCPEAPARDLPELLRQPVVDERTARRGGVAGAGVVDQL